MLARPAKTTSKPCASGPNPRPPRCHFPSAAVAYPASRSASASVRSSSGSSYRIFGWRSFWDRVSGRPGRYVVSRSRAGAFPVRIAAREGEQIGCAQ